MDLRQLDLNLLPVFDALLRHHSVTLAAQELDMSQSAMSAALARLRDALGDTLFVRTGRGLAPTPRALALAEPLAAVLQTVRDRFLATDGFEPASSGRGFNVCHSDVGSYVLWPRIVAAVRAAAPGVRLGLRVLPQAAIAQALERAEIDLAIGAYPGLPASLFQKRLFERSYVGLVRADHPLAGRRLSARQFARTPQLAVRVAARVQESIERQLARQGLRRADVIEMPSYLMLPPLVASGDFLAVMPGQLADAFSRHGQFASLELPFKLPATIIRIHWHRRFREDPGNVWLRGVIARLFA